MYKQQHISFAVTCADIGTQGPFEVVNLGPFDKYIEEDLAPELYEEYDCDCDEAPESTRTECLVQQLDANLLTSGLLISPFCALARLPALSMSPVLRTIAWLGYVLVATSFVTSAIFRLRMKFLATPERTALFAQELSRAQAGYWSLKTVAVSSPAITIYGSITVFLVLLSGWTLGPDVGGISTLDAIASTGKLETTIFTSAIICGILHCGLVLRTAIKLG